MAKSKSISTKAAPFAKGGNTKMFGQQHAGPQTPDHTGQVKKGPGGKFAKGGSGGAIGKQSASPKVAGTTGKP